MDPEGPPKRYDNVVVVIIVGDEVVVVTVFEICLRLYLYATESYETSHTLRDIIPDRSTVLDFSY